MRTIPLITSLLLLLLPGLASAQEAPPAQLPRTAAPGDAMAYILSPSDGAEVRSPFTVRFGLRGMGVAPAGVQAPDTGHHHLLINVDDLPDESVPLPATDSIRHFGKGQTETELDLAPGEYRLQLTLGDALHIPHSPPVRSEIVTITVAAP